METVASDTGGGEPSRQREGLGLVGLATMKGGVKARDLRNMRRYLENGPDRRKIARLVQRSQLHKLR